jgi:L-aminopeptidase/D-esterase-like protein
VTFEIAGVRIGHWTGDGTGVTVVLLPPDTVGSAEIRGGAPATREVALLDPERTVAHVDAVVFSGGSAFGLATADGVMRHLAERGRGYKTAGGPVPIVPTACVFDLVAAHGAPVPGPAEGRAAVEAAEAAAGSDVSCGRVGAGTGATVGKWRGREHAVAGGVGVASTTIDDARVAALAVVNALGDVVDDDGTTIAGSTAPPDTPAFPTPAPFEETNTTLVAVVTDAALDKAGCHLVAQSAHDGLARALRPSHTRYDGDLAIALATGVVEAPLDRIRIVAADVVAGAIRAACR